jgi:hypothetical protein
MGSFFNTSIATPVTLVTATRPSNTASDGVALDGWATANGRTAVESAILVVDSTLAGTITSPTGGTLGPELWGLILGEWRMMGLLDDIVIVDANRGAAIPLGAIACASRIAVAGTPSAGAPNFRLLPIEVE